MTLEVEFMLPAFFRKKLCRRKQRVEINKYKKSNFIKRFLFTDADLTLEKVAKVLEEEKEVG